MLELTCKLLTLGLLAGLAIYLWRQNRRLREAESIRAVDLTKAIIPQPLGPFEREEVAPGIYALRRPNEPMFVSEFRTERWVKRPRSQMRYHGERRVRIPDRSR